MKRLTELIPWKRKKELVSPSMEHPFLDLPQRVNDFFNNVFYEDRTFPNLLFEKSGLFPRLDVKEEKRKIIVEAEMPGVESKDIDVALEGRLLKIKAEKKQEHSDSAKGYCRHERDYGCYQRTIELPAEVDEEKVEASYKRGVLKIEMKKARESETKRIEVKAV
jgi:HSP20 family protein